MITKFEEYDELYGGDYVLIHTDSSDYSFREFINNNIGRISNVFIYGRNKDNTIEGDIIVKYDIPKELKNWFNPKGERQFYINQIVAFGKTKEDIEIKKNMKKYNL